MRTAPLWRVALLVLMFCLLMVFWLGFLAGRASAQEPQHHHHPYHEDFYSRWKQPGTELSCCNARIDIDGSEVGDCEPAKAGLRRGADGEAHWFAWLRQETTWIEVPDAKIIHERNPNIFDGHLCWAPQDGVLCFVPPDTGG